MFNDRVSSGNCIAARSRDHWSPESAAIKFSSIDSMAMHQSERTSEICSRLKTMVKYSPKIFSALYETDDKFHHINRSYRNQMKSKLFSRWKNNLYGYVFEFVVSPLRFAVYENKYYPGSVADFTALCKKTKNDVMFTTKNVIKEICSTSMIMKGDINKGAFFLMNDILASKERCLQSYRERKAPENLFQCPERKKRRYISRQDHCQELVWEISHAVA